MPDSPSLLVRLQKYAPRGKNNPKENFLTEAFVWVLEKCPEFAENFINELNEITQGTKFDTDPEHWKWKTQEYLKDGSNSGIVDIVGKPAEEKDKGPHILIEVKLGSDVDEDQLQRYANNMNPPDGSKVFLIKPELKIFESEKAGNIHKITWECINEIARSVKDTYKHNYSNGSESLDIKIFALEEFICLLDEFDLRKISSHLPEEFDKYLEEGVDMHIFETLDKSFYVVQTMEKALKKAAIKLNEDKDIHDVFRFVETYGRFGIACSEISKKEIHQNPGFTAGFICFPERHGLQNLYNGFKKNNEDNVVLPAIFCIDIYTLTKYMHKYGKEYFKNFTYKIREEFEHKGYTFFDDTKYIGNFKYPFILYKKIDDLIKNINDNDKQETSDSLPDELYKLVKDIYKVILGVLETDKIENALDVLEERYNKQQEEKDA